MCLIAVTVIVSTAAAFATLTRRSGFFYPEITTFVFTSVNRFDGRIGLLVIRHFYESEPARGIGVAIGWDRYLGDLAVIGEDLTNLILIV